MSANPGQADQQKRIWWRPAALLGLAALLILFIADVGTSSEVIEPPAQVERDPIQADSDDVSDETAISIEESTTDDAINSTATKLDPGWFWSVSYLDGPSSLWLSSPESERRLGQTVDENGDGVRLNDLAISPTGELFAISLTDLYQLNPIDKVGDTIPMTKVGTLSGAGSANALTFLSDGRLIAAGSKGVSEIDTQTAKARTLLTFEPGYRSSGDMVVMPDDTLLLTVNLGTTADALAQIRLPDSGFEMLMDNLPPDTYGLTENSGELFGLHVATDADPDCKPGGVLIKLDLASKTTTMVRCLAFAPGGTAHSSN